jgi:tetratricopeptide (TPR) repeat protein
MRVNKKNLTLFILLGIVVLMILVAIPLWGYGFITKLRARDKLNKGVVAFAAQKYDDAAKLFEESVALDPEFQTARMYLATAYSSMFVPGSPDPKSKEMAEKAIKTFEEMLETNPNNENAMISIASLYYQMDDSGESKKWCARILAVDPNNAEALYRIAVIDYNDSYKATGIQGENVEFLTADEKGKILNEIQEGLDSIDKALKIRPDYFDAMEYQNLLWREKAKFEKDKAAKAELIHQADLVAQKALAMRIKAQEEEARKPKKLAAGK